MSRLRTLNTGADESTAADTWRDALEMKAALAWSAAGTLTAAAGMMTDPVALIPAAGAFWMAAVRGHQAYSVLRARASLAGRGMLLENRKAFAGRMRPVLEQGRIWFGRGFLWQPEHSQKLYELSKIDAARLIPPLWITRRLLGRSIKDPDTIGQGFIHGVSLTESDLTVAEKTLEGGTLIVGTTQAGKGVLLTSLITESVLRGDTVIVLDPKNSGRLKDALFKAAELAGREAPLVLDPALKHEGVLLNPLTSYARPSELAGRLTAVMTEEGPFKAFAWSAVHTVASLFDFLGEKPTIASLKAALTDGPGALLLRALTRVLGTESVARVTEAATLSMKSRETVITELLALYEKEGRRHPVIDAAAAVMRHDPDHYAKITASLMPVLEMLTSGPLRRILSPQDTPEEDTQSLRVDTRPVVSLAAIARTKGILYAALDSLPDPTLASALGSILTADLASLAGERYRTGKTGERIALFVDECSNVIARPLIELLNKGAEAGVRTTCAMQTVSDLAARLGSEAAARMALGNFNNLIALRTKDRFTQEFAAETFGRTYIANAESSVSSTADGNALTFTAAVTRRRTSSREELVPADVLGKLPNCEFFAALAGGKLVKGRIPILID